MSNHMAVDKTHSIQHLHDSVKAAAWKQHFERFQLSGLSVQRFCSAILQSTTSRQNLTPVMMGAYIWR